MENPLEMPGQPGPKFRYLLLHMQEGQRRTASGHQRAQLQTTMFLGLTALYGGLWVSPIRLPWWGPLGSIAIAFVAFVLLLWVSRPYLDGENLLRSLFVRRSPVPDYGSAYNEALVVTDQDTLRKMAWDVDFYRWGVPRREVQYLRSAAILVLSVVPTAVAITAYVVR